MNVSHPNTESEVYKQFCISIKYKVGLAEMWLIQHKIDYVWNYWASNHLYRIYIPVKDVLFDFEYFPVNNYEYNYIRINFDTDIIKILERLFPETIINTDELSVWNLNQKSANHFLRENDVSPVYDKNVLRLAFVKDSTVYQCVIVKDNKIIRNVIKSNCSVPYGTYMMLRYLTEMFGYPEIFIKDSTDNSYLTTTYQLIGTSVVSQMFKKKIWWSPNGTKWKIKKEQLNDFVPFYYCENRIYKYTSIVKTK